MQWFYRRLFDASHGRRGAILAGAFLIGWTGIAFVGGWALVHFPGGVQRLESTEPQPAPDWLWQVGLAGLIAAAVIFLITVATTRRPVAAAAKEPVRVLSDGAVLGPMLVCLDVPMVLSSAVSSDSRLWWLPLMLASVCTTMILVNARTHWFW